MRYKYQLDNLNCANCAGKIEAKIAETDGFEDVSFNFATKLLNFKSEKQNPVSEIQAICDSIEDGVTVVDKTPKTYLKKAWAQIKWLDCTDPEYISAILDYSENAAQDRKSVV